MVAGPEEKENCMHTNEQSGGPESDCGEPSGGSGVDGDGHVDTRRADSCGASGSHEPPPGGKHFSDGLGMGCRAVPIPTPPEILARREEARHILTHLLCRLHETKRRGERKAA